MTAVDVVLGAIAREWPHPASAEVRAAVANAHWSDDRWKYDWRSEVPVAVRRLWPTLSEESRLAVYLVCEGLFQRQP